MATATIAVSVKARTSKARKKLKRFARTVKRLGATIRNVAKRVAQAGVAFVAFGVAVAVAFQRITRAGETFNQKMNRSLAIMSGVSESLRKTMKRTALEVARTTVHSAEQAAEAYFFLASAGLSVKQSIAALPFVAKFAQAGMFDMARATDLLTDAQSALGLTVKDVQQNMLNMKRVGNVLVKANTLSNATVEEFAEALTTKAGAALKVLNKDLEEGVAVLMAFADQGVKGAQGGTALDIVIRELTSKLILNEEAFKRYNVEVFNSVGKMRDLDLIISDVEQALVNMADKGQKATLMQLGFTNKSVGYMQVLLGLSGRMNEYVTQLRLVGDITKRVADKQLTPMEKALAKLQAAWVALSDALTPAVDAVAMLMEQVAEASQAFIDSFDTDVIVDFVETSLNELERLAKGAKGIFDRISDNMSTNFRLFKVSLLASAPGQLVTGGIAIAGLAKKMGMLGGGDADSGSDIARYESLLKKSAGAGEPGLGTRIREKLEARAQSRIFQVAKERWRGLFEDLVVWWKKGLFEAQRKPGGPGGVLGEQAPAGAGRRPVGEFMQVSPGRFHIPGYSAARREQTVKDPEGHRILRRIETKVGGPARFV